MTIRIDPEHPRCPAFVHRSIPNDPEIEKIAQQVWLKASYDSFHNWPDYYQDLIWAFHAGWHYAKGHIPWWEDVTASPP